MLWETLELTAEELALPKPEKLQTFRHNRKATSRYQRQGKSLMGVA